ncbi:MAG: hypothetical protein KGM24_03125 [Elusimicrobia bacterium]|nr:hypothetical protein [Elusimicrobiota bacterium]
MARLLALALLVLAVRPAAAAPDARALASYRFDASRPADRRVARIPDWLLALWRQADGAPGYRAYAPTPAQRRILAETVDGLPPRLREALDERLIAFYFVKNLKGNGLTDWVLDASSRTYVYMLLNPAGFDESLSAALTGRERSAFRGKADVRVDAGPGGSGMLYTVTHESAHAFDYVRGLTPYTEPRLGELLGRAAPNGWDVWESYANPRPADDFPARAKLRFYGFGAPELAAAEAPAVCAQLAASPFASLYGSRTWAEDAAELFVARHLTQDLGRPLRLICGGKSYEPMKNPRVRARAEKLLASIYGPLAQR